MINWDKFDQGNVSAFYGSWTWKKKRKAILERDHHLCQRCLGKYGKVKMIKLTRANTVHHIVPVKQDHTLALVNDNLVSLCYRCHEEIEGRTEPNGFKKKERLTSEMW